MRLVGELDNIRWGEQFAAYLVTIGIPARSDEIDQERCEVWVNEEDQLSQAKSELADFLANPKAPKYSVALFEAAKISRQTEDKRRRIQKKIVVGTNRMNPKPQMTIALIAICVLVALFSNFGQRKDLAVYQALAFIRVPAPKSIEIIENARGNYDDINVRLASLWRGEIWRTVTPMLIHHSQIHLLFNMIWLFQLGRAVELRYGRWKYLGLILIAAAISNLVQCVMPVRFGGAPPGFLEDGTLISGLGGMSGVVYALFGFVWTKSVVDPASRFMMHQSTITIMLVWLVFCMLPGSEGQSLTMQLFGFSVANWAHAIGLLVGIVAGFMRFDHPKKQRAGTVA